MFYPAAISPLFTKYFDNYWCQSELAAPIWVYFFLNTVIERFYLYDCFQIFFLFFVSWFEVFISLLADLYGSFSIQRLFSILRICFHSSHSRLFALQLDLFYLIHTLYVIPINTVTHNDRCISAQSSRIQAICTEPAEAYQICWFFFCNYYVTTTVLSMYQVIFQYQKCYE